MKVYSHNTKMWFFVDVYVNISKQLIEIIVGTGKRRGGADCGRGGPDSRVSVLAMASH